MFENNNPVIYEVRLRREVNDQAEFDDNYSDLIDNEEVFDHVRDILDPEHPLTLEQLNVVSLDKIHCDDLKSTITVYFQPTIPKCSTASFIGLAITVKLWLSLPSRFKISVLVYPGSHDLESEINKQLNDKERVTAAIENEDIMSHLKTILNFKKIDLSN